MPSPTTDPPGPPEAVTLRSRTVVVTFLGAVVRRLGDWMPIGGTVELMTQLGLDAQSVRTAVFRLKRRGWLESQTLGGMRGYALTGAALTTLAAGDEVIWHSRRPAELADGWCVISFSVPEHDRTMRHQLRSQLTTLGFGNAGSALWIAPARMLDAARMAIDGLRLTDRCAMFVGPYAGGQDLRRLAAQAWDLDEIDAGYVQFLERYSGLATASVPDLAADPKAAFISYLAVVDHWRKLPFRDPGLPPDVLPGGWHGPRAAALFNEIVDRLQAPAMQYAAQYWPA